MLESAKFSSACIQSGTLPYRQSKSANHATFEAKPPTMWYIHLKILCIIYIRSTPTHTVVSSREVLVEHPFHNLSNITRQWLTRTQVDCLFVHLVVCHGGALKDVQCSPHVPLRQSHKTLHTIHTHFYTGEVQQMIMSVFPPPQHT